MYILTNLVYFSDTLGCTGNSLAFLDSIGAQVAKHDTLFLFSPSCYRLDFYQTLYYYIP